MIRDIFREQKILVIAGLLSFATLVVLGALSLSDQVEISGVNRWIKPMKFSLSIGVYLFTIAVYLRYIEGRRIAKSVIGVGIALLMAGELALIITQAARGVRSHFNIDTSFDNAVFSAMGLMIVANTILIFYLLYLYFRAHVKLPRTIVLGMQLGLILLIFSSVAGGYMSVILQHSIGVADGGAGLPFVNWSTEGGDLRAAHFFGMHALQLLPLFAVVTEKIQPARASLLTFGAGLFYFLVFTGLFVQALAGRPLLSF